MLLEPLGCFKQDAEAVSREHLCEVAKDNDDEAAETWHNLQSVFASIDKQLESALASLPGVF